MSEPLSDPWSEPNFDLQFSDDLLELFELAEAVDRQK